MGNLGIKTYFAPAERTDEKTLAQQVNELNHNKILSKIADAMPNMLVVLNKERQIVYANKLFLDNIQIENIDLIFNYRPGEVLKCVHAKQMEGGCGTSEHCRHCGAGIAILEAQNKLQQSIKECRILTEDDEAYDLEVIATPYTNNNIQYTIYTLMDISDKKRRDVLEKVFFHDVLNSAGGISGLSTILHEMTDPESVAEISQLIQKSSENLIEEIKAQRQLSSAESGDLEPELSDVFTADILNDLANLYSRHEIIADKTIIIDKKALNKKIKTDPVILRRIIGNLIKNALEASLPEGIVTVSCAEINNSVQFSIHNQTYMERKIQLQLFKRSFSTKGRGRGIGTYSIKLLGEKYLNGKVWFESNEEKGTTFYFKLPLEHN